MDYEDRLTITTPEGIDLHLLLAGLGSRFAAALIDGVIKTVLTVAVIVATFGLPALFDFPRPDISAAVGFALFAVATLLINFFYDVLFEVLASGRTPGKRWTGLRVLLDGGRPVGFRASTIRNVLRLIDGLPAAYGIGMVAILVSKRNQRLGDLAAGTVVVRDVQGARPTAGATRTAAEAPLEWDVSAVTAEEIGAVRAFLDRRAGLQAEARGRLAWELAERLRPKVGGAPSEQHPEVFLEQLAAAKAARG